MKFGISIAEVPSMISEVAAPRPTIAVTIGTKAATIAPTSTTAARFMVVGARPSRMTRRRTQSSRPTRLTRCQPLSAGSGRRVPVSISTKYGIDTTCW
ncbi:hypothetical protein ACIBCD_19810 [Nocardia brasiliensis]|uniref:hypothetical protein n=1 Tax=Nocardia brasiliensis TaxID=37326 RepID=UPI00379925B9